jgi:hypothetical protein
MKSFGPKVKVPRFVIIKRALRVAYICNIQNEQVLPHSLNYLATLSVNRFTMILINEFNAKEIIMLTTSAKKVPRTFGEEVGKLT